MSAFDDYLDAPAADRCFVLKLTALAAAPLSSSDSWAFGDGGFADFAFGEDTAGDAGGVTQLYFSDRGYTSQPADTPASTWFDSRIASSPVVSRTGYGVETIGGLTRVFAVVDLVNADGG